MSIDVRSISITGAFNAIKAFFLSQENNSTWKDTETGAEGNFLMRLLANVIRVISQNVITGRREIFQDTANLLSSNIGIATTTGSYPTFRGRNQRRLIDFTPNENKTIPKLTQIGTYSGDYGIYTTDDLTFVAGEAQEFTVVIGALKEISWNANTSSLKKFFRFEQGISEDVDLLVDGTSMNKENALSKYVKDMIYNKYCILTNPWKSVTVMYLNNSNNATHKYSSDTVFTLRYIELDDVESVDFTDDMFPDYGTLNNVLTIENYIPFEEVDSIKINAPVHREVQSLVRSKIDFSDLVNEFTPSINQTNALALTPTYTAVTYMKKDKSLLEKQEYDSLMNSLEPCTAFGRPLPDIVNPVREITTLDITLGALNRYTDEANITEDVESIVNSNYADVLNTSFDKYDLENALNKLSYAKYSRVDLHIGERTANTLNKLGDLISANNSTYKCTGILGQTGINEPEWNIPSSDTAVEKIYTGLETTDNTIIWACYKRLNISSIQPWKPSKKIALGEFVYSESIPQYMFRAIDLVRKTSINPPDVVGVEVGDYVQDNYMILLCITYNSAYPDRLSNHQYRLGDKFNISGLSFEYVGINGRTGSDETLVFNDANYELLAFTGSDYDKAYELDGGQTCLYIDDREVANMVNENDILRINLVEQVDKKWEELSDDELTMNSKLDTKVKEYEDEEKDSSDEGEDETEEVTVNIKNYYTGNVIPDISTVELGGSISDGDFTLNRVPYDETYPERISAYMYNNNDRFTITVWKEEGGETVVDYAYSFAVVEPVEEAVTTEVAPVQEEEEPEEEQNANWKELERYLAIEDEVQEWIESESADKLRCPEDVVNFFNDIGKITNEERDNLLNYYYKQYDEADEHQIYMYMDMMNATRQEAIDVLTREDGTLPDETKVYRKHLKAPVSTARCVRQYDENNNLVYVDEYSAEEPLTVQNAEGEWVTYTSFKITRTDMDFIVRAVRTYIYKDANTIVLYDEEITNDSEEVSKTYLVTAVNAMEVSRDYNGRVKKVTRIIPTAPIPKYSKGSVNISFRKTDDGDIRWEEVDTVDSIDYDWNVFTNFDVNLTVKY